MIKNERGFTLIEVVIAIALLGIISVALLSGLATASRALVTTDERATAESLARSQMEYVKTQTYASPYTPAPIPAEYANYSATIDAISIAGKGGLQKITVKIYHHDDAHDNPPVLTLEGYKADR